MNINMPHFQGGINFKDTVIYNRKTNCLYQASSWERVLRYIVPGLASYQDRKVMSIMCTVLQQPRCDDNYIKYSKQMVARAGWFCGAQAAQLSKAIFLCELESLGLDKNIAEQYPDFVKFIRTNHLHHKMRSHSEKVDVINSEPAIKFEGVLTSWGKVKMKLEQIYRNKQAELNRKDQTITDKSEAGLEDFKKNYHLDSIGCCYLGFSDKCPGGIINYNPSTWEYRDSSNGTLISDNEPMPWGKIGEKEEAGPSSPYMEIITDCRAEEFPDRILENNDHAFVKLVDDLGNIYYFGLTCKPSKNRWEETRGALATNHGLIQCPDTYADTPHNFRYNKKIELTLDQYYKAFEQAKISHEVGVGYSPLGNDCVEFVRCMSRAAGHVISPEHMEIELYKLAPKSLQFAYRWTPLPGIAKRWMCRKLLNIIGFKSGQKLEDGTPLADAENHQHADFTQDLRIAHPRQLAQHLKNPDQFPDYTEVG